MFYLVPETGTRKLVPVSGQYVMGITEQYSSALAKKAVLLLDWDGNCKPQAWRKAYCGIYD